MINTSEDKELRNGQIKKAYTTPKKRKKVRISGRPSEKRYSPKDSDFYSDAAHSPENTSMMKQ